MEDGDAASKGTLLLAGHQIEAAVSTTNTEDGGATLTLAVSLSWGGRVSFSVVLPHLVSPQPTGNDDGEEPSPKNGRKKRRRKGSDERRTQQLHAAKRQHAGKPAMTEAEILLSLPPEIMVCISLPPSSPPLLE